MATRVEEMVEDVRSADGCIGGIRLSQWEQEFVGSIEERLAEGRTLTPRQLEVLTAIWDRI